MSKNSLWKLESGSKVFDTNQRIEREDTETINSPYPKGEPMPEWKQPYQTDS